MELAGFVQGKAEGAMQGAGAQADKLQNDHAGAVEFAGVGAADLAAADAWMSTASTAPISVKALRAAISLKVSPEIGVGGTNG